jgi:hypothetical protein
MEEEWYSETLESYYNTAHGHNLKMEAARFSETSLSYITKRCHNREMEAARSSETLVPQDSVTTWRWRQQSHPKRWYPTTSLHGVTILKTSTSNISSLKSFLTFLRDNARAIWAVPWRWYNWYNFRPRTSQLAGAWIPCCTNLQVSVRFGQKQTVTKY